MPALAGLAAPWWDSSASGVVHRDDAVAAAAGTWSAPCWRASPRRSPALADLVATDLGQPLTRLRVDGGLTRSAVLMQAQADLARIPVDVYPSLHATALGAAACARLSLDPDVDVAEAVGTWTPDHTYEPRLVRRPRRRLHGAVDAAPRNRFCRKRRRRTMSDCPMSATSS